MGELGFQGRADEYIKSDEMQRAHESVAAARATMAMKLSSLGYAASRIGSARFIGIEEADRERRLLGSLTRSAPGRRDGPRAGGLDSEEGLGGCGAVESLMRRKHR